MGLMEEGGVLVVSLFFESPLLMLDDSSDAAFGTVLIAR